MLSYPQETPIMNTILAKRLTLLNRRGMSTELMVELVKTVYRVWPRTQVRYIYGDKVVDGRSIMGIVSIGADWGDKMLVEACGPDALEVLETITELFNKRCLMDADRYPVPTAHAEWIERPDSGEPPIPAQPGDRT